MAASTLSFRAYLSNLSGRKLGAFKTAAAKLGIAFEEYIERIEAGEKCCVDCKSWKGREDFGIDRSRWDGLSAKCRNCSSGRKTESYEPIPVEEYGRFGPLRGEPRPGDKVQARHFVNLDVKQNLRPNPNNLHCVLCGHKGDDRRHEYHHHMGYAPEHVYDVVPLCSTCHHFQHKGE